jgi:3-hydroxyisobutyrate dehydrogenase
MTATAQESAVAVIGLGAMGLPMATRLAERHRVFGFDVSSDRCELAADRGVQCAHSPREAMVEATVIVLAIRDQAQLESVLCDNSALESLRPGAIMVLTSTVGPDAARQASSALAERSIDLIDAPVSGGAIRAAAGELLFMVGASPEVLERGRWVLEDLATTIYVAGTRVGDGQIMKVVNQLLCGVHTAAAAEALNLARALGLDLNSVVDVVGKGAGASFMLADRGPRMVQAFHATPEVRSRLDVISKDMGIVARVAQAAGVATPVAAAAEQLYRLGLTHGLAAQDDSTIVGVLSPGTGDESQPRSTG